LLYPNAPFLILGSTSSLGSIPDLYDQLARSRFPQEVNTKVRFYLQF